MQQREVRVYLLDALAAAEQIVSIRDEVGAKRLREDRIVRAAVERRIEAAAVGAWLAGRGSSAGASGRGGRVHGCPGMAVNLAAIARIVAAAG